MSTGHDAATLPQPWREDLEFRVRNAVHDERAELGLLEHVRDGWTCPHCGEVTTVSTEGLPWPITSVQPRCRCIREAEAAAREAILGDVWAEAVAKMWSESGVPARYAGCRFENFEPVRGAEKAVAVCRKYAEAFERCGTDRGLYLVGTWGAGKSHLAVAMLYAVLNSTFASVAFVTEAGLLSSVKPGSSGRWDFSAVKVAASADLLVLDDLAQQPPTEWARGIVYELLDTRHQQCRPSIITSNAGDGDLARLYGGALASRLCEDAALVEIKAGDYRQRMARRAA